MVNTIRGAVDADQLGRTLVHEHIAIRTPGIAENWPDRWDHDAVVASSEVRLGQLAERGIQTLIDLTTADMGRDIPLLTAVAERTSIHIVCASGVYWIVPRYWWNRTADDLASAFVADITTGINGGPVKAGIIKLASDHEAGGVNELNEKCLRAGARAHRQTGVPISTHNNPPTLGVEQQRVFADEGVDLSRVVIGHQGDTADLTHLKQIMERGSYLGLDRFGMNFILPFDDRVQTVAKLCADGYAERLLLSHDASCALDWIPNRELLETNAPDWHFNHIPDRVVPALLAAGVSQEHVDLMLIGNPARLFERSNAY